MINITNPNGGVGLAFKLNELNQHFLFGEKKSKNSNDLRK